MKNVKVALKIVVALAVIVAAAYWAITSARSQTYAGNELEFTLGGGKVVITNHGEEPVPAVLSARGSTAAFTVSSSNPELSVRSTREGSGASAMNTAEIMLPPGESDLQLTRGSNVTLRAESEARLEAKVARVSTNTLRFTLIVSAVAILGALYYISATLGHPWKGWLRGRVPGGAGQAEQRPSL